MPTSGASDDPSAGGPALSYRDGQGRARVFELPAGGRVTVGRGVRADLSLDWDARVSRVHAELGAQSDGWTLFDERTSTNGSYVNEEQVHGRRLLHDGDKLRFGHTVAIFRVGAAVAEAEPAQTVVEAATSGPAPG